MLKDIHNKLIICKDVFPFITNAQSPKSEY